MFLFISKLSFFTRQEKCDGAVCVHDDQTLSGFVGGLADELVLVGQRSKNWTGDL